MHQMWAGAWARVASRHATRVRRGFGILLRISFIKCITQEYSPHSRPELSRNLLRSVHGSVGPSHA